jgi:hypothetical protein
MGWLSMMSTPRAARAQPGAAERTALEIMHALPCVIVPSSVGVLAARGVPVTPNARPHRQKRHQRFKTIMFLQFPEENLLNRRSQSAAGTTGGRAWPQGI